MVSACSELGGLTWVVFPCETKGMPQRRALFMSKALPPSTYPACASCTHTLNRIHPLWWSQWSFLPGTPLWPKTSRSAHTFCTPSFCTSLDNSSYTLYYNKLWAYIDPQLKRKLYDNRNRSSNTLQPPHLAHSQPRTSSRKNLLGSFVMKSMEK